MIRRLKVAADFVLGAALPIRFTSRIYLGQKLAAAGVFDIPEMALQELADEAVRECQWLAKVQGRSWRTDVTDRLDGMAYGLQRGFPSIKVGSCWSAREKMSSNKGSSMSKIGAPSIHSKLSSTEFIIATSPFLSSGSFI